MVDIVKQIADTTGREKLDSSVEDKILEEWVEQNELPGSRISIARNGHYPARTKLTDTIVLNKEAHLGSYRIDCIAYWYKDVWKLIEVKQENEIGPSVLGDLLIKSEIFKEEFVVNPDNVEMVLLSTSFTDNYRRWIKKIESKYDDEIHLEELK